MYRLHENDSNNFIEATDTIMDAPFTIVVTICNFCDSIIFTLYRCPELFD